MQPTKPRQKSPPLSLTKLGHVTPTQVFYDAAVLAAIVEQELQDETFRVAFTERYNIQRDVRLRHQHKQAQQSC